MVSVCLFCLKNNSKNRQPRQAKTPAQMYNQMGNNTEDLGKPKEQLQL